MTNMETRPFLRSAYVLQHVLSFLLVALIVAALAVVMWVILDPRSLGGWLTQNSGYAELSLTVAQSVGLGAILISQIGIWSAVVMQGRRMFAALLDTDATDASDAARQAAWLLWLMLGWGILAGSLASVITSWNFPPGERTLSIAFGTAELSTLLAALLASFTSHAFVLGAELWRDHREVI